MNEAFRLLTPRSAKLDDVPGGIPSLTPEMLAAACKGLRPAVYYFALVYYVHDTQAVRGLRTHCKEEARQIIDNEKSDQLTDIALQDILAPELCKRCKGRGFSANQRACRNCRGTGRRRPPSIRRQAERLGVSPFKWRNHYAKDFAELVAHIQGFESEIASHIRRKLELGRRGAG